MENHCITFTSSSQLLVNFAKLQWLLLSEVSWASKASCLLIEEQKAMPKKAAT